MRFAGLFILSMFVHSIASAQTEDEQLPTPTQFDTFINRQDIEYAFYADDTIRFNKLNLNYFLIKKMHRLEILSAFPIKRRSTYANRVDTINIKNIVDIFYKFTCTLPMIDSFGNPIGTTDLEPEKTFNDKDSSTQNRLNIAQIYYFENNKLKSHIPWVSPTVTITTNSEIFLGIADYFSTCINLNPGFISSSNDEIINLESTKRRITLDSIFKFNKLKELYGRNLVETIWSGLIEGKNEAYDIKTGKKLSAYQVMKYSLIPPKITPAYSYYLADTIYHPITPSIFKEIEILQNWSYNVTQNILTSTIPEIILYAKRENENEVSPIIKVIFK